MFKQVAGVRIPDSQLACEATELVRDCESSLLFHHTLRVYFFGALRGRYRRMCFDPELVYLGALFHDVELTEAYRSATERFEVNDSLKKFRTRVSLQTSDNPIVCTRRPHRTIAMHRYESSRAVIVT